MWIQKRNQQENEISPLKDVLRGRAVHILGYKSGGHELESQHAQVICVCFAKISKKNCLVLFLHRQYKLYLQL